MKVTWAWLCVGFLIGCGGTEGTANSSGAAGAGATSGASGAAGATGGSAGAMSSSSGGGGTGPQGGACDDPVSPDPDVKQALPKTYVDTSLPAAGGKTIPVAAGGNLQQAIDMAQPGDVITLAAGASFTGPFVLPNKPGADYITVRTDTADASFPAPGTRVGPGDAAKMAKLIAPNTLPAIQTAAGAHHFRFIGVEVAPVDEAAQIYQLVEFGNGSITKLSDSPHHLILDRSYVHGTANGYTKRGVQVDCGDCAVIDSYVADCHAVGQDAQAIAGFNGSGPIKIVNNYLEGSGENVIFGGADPKIVDLVPSDIEIRENHFYKPLTWKVDDPSYAGNHWSVKNLLEFKSAARVLVRCNVFENNWADAQVGFAILLTHRNQDGTAPWSVVSDITISQNILRHSASGINISGEDDLNPSQQTARIVVTDNLIYDLSKAKFGGDARIFQIITPGQPTAGLKIEHNTAFVDGNAAVVMGDSTAVASGLILRDNIFGHGNYGVFGSGKGEGKAALEFFAPGYVFEKNVLIGYPEASYPMNNSFPKTADEVGFVDYAKENYRLDAASAFKGTGTGGKDPGAAVDDVLERTKNVVP
jgi:hypothetical protein